MNATQNNHQRQCRNIAHNRIRAICRPLHGGAGRN